MRWINKVGGVGAYGDLRTLAESKMTGEEAVVLGFVLVAFVIFGTTLAWVSSDDRRGSVGSADKRAKAWTAMRRAGRQPDR